MCEGLGAPAGERQQVGEPLARDARLGLAGLASGEGAQGALVVADRVVVGVDRARPVAGGQQVARAPGACPALRLQ